MIYYSLTTLKQTWHWDYVNTHIKTQQVVIIIVLCWCQKVNIAMGIYLPLISALLSDLILVATKLLAYTGYLLQSLRHRGEDRDTRRRQRYKETCWILCIAEELSKRKGRSRGFSIQSNQGLMKTGIKETVYEHQ